jgi:hypothetical protein
MKRRSFLPLACIGVLVALLALPGAALADTPVAHSGTYGPHYLTDTAEYPGASCHYNSNITLDRVRVRPPVIYAVDRGTGVDAQWVGWQIIVRGRGLNDSDYHVVSVSAVQKAVAYDNKPAVFTIRNAAVFHIDVKVAIKMIWYKPGAPNTIQGWARHRVDSYRDIMGVLDFCPSEHF